ncbi:hypothetical protein KP77_32390 [Jeotgalibacillus alimentarius]|uniref:GH29D-like beta-sandwich domain-containing protein n=1 Tax=Jeotgalibacillus alimentarius TaxID=135826 RepID=A0A0C2VHS6_9BACL|nr:CotH kinase family protein [Jeotgalibacillus alimentarius]KIL43533.1 hypothetical protein KP77_32390 [Jeotgalibacillus alimentarius]
MKKWSFALSVVGVACMMLGAAWVASLLNGKSSGEVLQNSLSGQNNTGVISFSLPSGLYEEGTDISLAADAEDIFYTLDGSEPTEQSTRYTAPLQISDTTVIRAAAKLEDGTLTPPYMQTYLTEPNDLPVISVAAEPEDLWSEEKGIYVEGPGASDEYPYEGANYWMDWKITVQMEYLKNQESVYSSLADMEIFGGETRTKPQRSFMIDAESEYGNSELLYPFFDSLPYSSYESIILRNGGQDFEKTHMLDALVSTLAAEIGLDAQVYQPVVLYLNGAYWGLYDLRERIDHHYFSRHHQVKRDDLVLLEADAEEKEGSDESYIGMIAYIQSNDPAEPEVYRVIEEEMDVENFIDYILTELYIGNTDWPSHNIRFWKNTNPETKWKWIVYDSDVSFQDATENTVQRFYDYKGKGDDKLYSSYLFRELLKNEQFRERFKERSEELYSSTLSSDHIEAVIERLAADIRPEMVRHLEKWDGDTGKWEAEVQALKSFARERNDYITQHIDELLNQYQQGGS